MDIRYKNSEIEKWLSKHNAVAEDDFELVQKVELMANVWHIDDDKDKTDVDSEKEPEEKDEEPEKEPEKEQPPISEKEDTDYLNPLYSGQSERVKQLKKKKIWVLINPFYRVYATVKVRMILFLREDKREAMIAAKNKSANKVKNFAGKVVRRVKTINGKILFKWRNRRSVIERRNKRFIEGITYSPEKIAEQRSTRFTKNVKFSVVVPLFNTPEQYLRDMIESVLNQTYENLELCLEDASDAEHVETVERICMEYAKKDARVHYEKLLKNDGIAENTNRCIEMATGNYIALLDHDDMYHPGALFACMECIEKEDAELVYTDEMTFQSESLEKIVMMHFKPDFSMQNLKGVNYICHLCVFKRSLLDQTGMFDNAYNGSQDHDMMLKLTSVAKVVSHVPEIMYFWRVHPQSVSMNINAKSYAIDAGKAAVRDNELRAGRKAEVFSSCICATHYRLEYQMEKEELVSIIILNKNTGAALAKLVDSIRKRTTYTNYEILIVDMNSTEKETLEYLSMIREEDGISVIIAQTASLSKVINEAVRVASGSCLAFLEANMEIVKRGWLNRMVPYAMQEEIGMIGAKITDSMGIMRSAGYIAGLGEDGIAVPIGKGFPYDAQGYMGRWYYVHNVSMISLWGTVMQKSKFEKIGGLDEELSTEYAAFDLCLRELGQKKQIAVDSYVITLEHEILFTELSGEDTMQHDQAYMKEKWRAFFEKGDPYYNKNLSRTGSFNYDYE